MKRELQLAALLACVILSGGALVLSKSQGVVFASVWLLVSLLLGSFVWLQCWRRLALNRASHAASLYPALGWANRITLIRGLLIAACGGFLLPAAPNLPIGWICGPLYTAAAVLDRVDGFVARRSGHTTLLGTELDTVVDALGLLVVPLLAMSLGKIHWSYLLVSVAYYLFQLGLYRRRHKGLAIYPLLPSNLRRAMAGFQMGFIAVVLWPPFRAPVTSISGIAFMVPVLIGFGVDWMVVSGSIQPHAPRTATLFRKLAAYSTNVFQPALRVLLLGALFMVSQNLELVSAAQDEGFWSVTVLIWTLAICGVLIALGFGGRIGAVLLLCLLACYVPAASVSSAMVVVIMCAVWILLLGCGRFSLWQYDDRWVTRYDGS